ncbi:MAG: TonB-dependent receptor, partial [Verrucomicrobia bacterium]|nr:TonB-dependent receptor [Verrucomicrobiota bacterium]
MKQMRNWLALGAWVSLVVSAGAEEIRPTGDSSAELTDMVISANRYRVPVTDVGSSVTVLEAADIAHSGQSTVLEVLRGVPGLEVTQSGGPGRIASVNMRGGSSSHTLVLIDGVRANAATLGAFDFANASVENVERIEVLLGPQSTLYGSEAIGGVIRITTKRGAVGQGGSARVEGGSPEQWYGAAEVHGGREAYDYSVSASWQQYNGLSTVDESVGATEDDSYENLSAAGRLGFAVRDDGRADFTFRAFSGESDVDGFEGFLVADDPNATTDRDGIAASASYRQPLADWWNQSVLVGVYDETLKGDDPDSEFNNYRIDNRNLDFSAQSDLTPLALHVFSLGYEFENRAGKSGEAYDKNLDIHSVYVQDQWNPVGKLHVTAGARVDEHEEFGSEPTYRGTVSYGVPLTSIRLHGSAGTGFKAPTFSDLYFPDFGNPDLDPESSVGYDAGIEVGLADLAAVVDVTWFRNDFTDLISFDSTTMLAANVEEANAQGLEVSGQVSLCTNAQLGASYTYTDSEDEQTGAPLARRPKQRYTVQAWYQPVTRLNTSLALVAVRERLDSDGTDMDDYTRVDVMAEYALLASVYPYVRIENVFDEDYEEVNGFSSPGFTGIGGVRVVW